MRHRRAALLAALSVLAAAGSAAAESLGEAVAYAYETNPGIQAQRAALRALDESFVQARTSFGPSVSATASDTYQTVGRGAFAARAETNSQGITINQPLFTGGRLSARMDAAEAQILAGRENLRRLETELIQRVVAAYTGVRRDERILAISQESVRVLEQHLADTEAKFRVRQVTRTDVEQARARLAQARTQIVNAQSQLGQSRAVYATVVGRLPEALEPEPQLDAVPPTIEKAFDVADANAPTLRAAQFTEKASRERIALARAERRPTVSARLSAENSPFLQYQETPRQEAFTATIAIQQPLWSGGQTDSRVRQALEENNRDVLLIEDAQRTLIQNVSTSWEQLLAARRAVETTREEVRANEIAAAGVRAEERFALRSNIEILNAEAELRNAQINLARNLYNEYVGRAVVLGTIGALTPSLFGVETPVYDPTKNFDRVKGKAMLPWEPLLRGADRVAKPWDTQPPVRDSQAVRPPADPLPAAPDPNAPMSTGPIVFEKIPEPK